LVAPHFPWRGVDSVELLLYYAIVLFSSIKIQRIESESDGYIYMCRQSHSSTSATNHSINGTTTTNTAAAM